MDNFFTIEKAYKISRYGNGDFYVQMDGPNGGRPFKERPSHGNYYAVTVNPNIFDARYFYYLVEYLHSSGRFKKYLHGVAIVHLTIPNFNDAVMDFFKEQQSSDGETYRISENANSISPGKYIVYHGTGSRFKKFNLKKSTMGLIWFTSDKSKILKQEAGASSSGFIITAEVEFKKPAGWNEYEKLLIFQLKSEGYDGAILPDGNGSHFDCFVFDPKKVKIIKIEKIKSLTNEQKVDKKEYEKRYENINKFIEKMIEKAPGKNREEKLKYVWLNYPNQMKKLMKAQDFLRKPSIFGRIGDEPLQSYKSKFIADKYYIRFGDFPSSGKSKNYATGKSEIGISSYPVKWNIEKNKWEIIEDQLWELAALYSLTDDITQGIGRPIYLVQGQEMDDLGSDGEPLLDIGRVKIIKKLDPSEFFSYNLGDDWYIT